MPMLVLPDHHTGNRTTSQRFYSLHMLFTLVISYLFNFAFLLSLFYNFTFSLAHNFDKSFIFSCCDDLHISPDAFDFGELIKQTVYSFFPLVPHHQVTWWRPTDLSILFDTHTQDGFSKVKTDGYVDSSTEEHVDPVNQKRAGGGRDVLAMSILVLQLGHLLLYLGHDPLKQTTKQLSCTAMKAMSSVFHCDQTVLLSHQLFVGCLTSQ